MNSIDIEKLPEFDDHKFVTFFSDQKTGLRAFVAVHNDTLGPGTGGTRMWVYPSETDALRDVLNLSRAMTFKCALAGVPYGGSKGVILGDPHRQKTPELLRAYARRFDSLEGVTTGTDVGIEDQDVEIMRQESSRFLGVPDGKKMSTAIATSLGVFSAIKGVARVMWGSDDLRGKRFAVKGVGKAGMELLKLLVADGGDVVVAEIDKDRVGRVRHEFPKVRLVDSPSIHKQDVDFFCPCALGGDLNSETVKELRCSAIVGAANNQLQSNDIGDWLHRSGIVYAPDYVVNAGGLITIVDELEKDGYDRQRVLSRVNNIGNTVEKILDRSQKTNQSSNRVADEMAEEIFKKS